MRWRHEDLSDVFLGVPHPMAPRANDGRGIFATEELTWVQHPGMIWIGARRHRAGKS